jgi:hypothetical protein
MNFVGDFWGEVARITTKLVLSSKLLPPSVKPGHDCVPSPPLHPFDFVRIQVVSREQKYITLPQFVLHSTIPHTELPSLVITFICKAYNTR